MELNVTCEYIAVETKDGMLIFYCRKPSYVYIEDVVKGED